MYKVITIFAIAASMFLVTDNIYAQGPSIPAFILGSVTSNGILVEKGKTLYIFSDNIALASAVIEENGRFGPVEIPKSSNSAITFKLDNDNINETYVWQSGVISLALTVSVSTLKDVSDNPISINNIPSQNNHQSLAITPARIIDLTGAQGSVGEQGVSGDAGIIGDIGPSGPAGIVGPPGPPGPQGLLGEIGPIGESGVQGEKGVPGMNGKSNRILNYAGVLFSVLGIISAAFVYREYRNLINAQI